ncbi:Cellulase (glycosyl hydrolase family 5) [Bradyrhizobium brasilense]|uniref:Cellulase (Glycosyl hydrolase family 5) n=1 Tax=Bradyrhizobium brasilense TaxID=1419277 RepID=A0A1G6L4R0_9BRAD|nr:Cellulase (glycosyl hydrolase family 5) [Bradyrhizobium brasilense]
MQSRKNGVPPRSRPGLSRRHALRAAACAAAYGVTRSPVFGQPTAAPSLDRQSDVAFTSSHDRLRGINIQQPFAHWQKGEPWNIRRGWDSWMPKQRLERIAASGVDFLRICVDPAPLLAVETKADLTSGIETVLRSVDAVLQAGMKVLFDVHVSTEHEDWNIQTLTDGIAGPHFLRLVEVETSIAAALQTRYDPQSVALELFNEPPPPSDFSSKTAWAEQLKHLYDAVRSAAPKHTLLLSGMNYASIDGLLSIDVKAFDANTIFVFHYYEPFIFTLQGVNLSYSKYLHRLQFPPQPSDRARAIERAIGLLKSDEQTSVLRKEYLVQQLMSGADQYFNVPQDIEFIRRRVGEVAAWSDQNKVDRKRIMCGEFGCFGDFAGRTGAALSDRAMWLQSVRQAVEDNGFGWCVHDLDESFRITSDNGAFIPELLAALGLRKP